MKREIGIRLFYQERANEGLGKLGAPAAQRKHKKDEVEVIKDNEIDELAETM